jgi:hypothetical protein
MLHQSISCNFARLSQVVDYFWGHRVVAEYSWNTQRGFGEEAD